MPADVDPRWYDGFFDDDWLQLEGLRPPEERTLAQVDFVVERLGLEPGARILDVPCGHGRHSVELARRGFRVTGVDLSAPSLERARAAADEAGVDLELVRADMRELAFDGDFDAVLNLFTSFGYLETQADDERALAGFAQALRPGGALLLDVINPPGLFRKYRGRDWEAFDDGTLFLSLFEYDPLAGRNVASWTFVRPDGTRSELRHSLRVYTAAELRGMLERAGLAVEQAWGGWDGADLDLDSWRLILLARRPAA